jgi:excisionase family DNA binding protein
MDLQLISAKDLAKKLGVPPVTVFSWVRRGVIPHYKIERCVRFDAEEIETWLKDKKRGATG